mgnify:CR=1 FL=1|tara:strand:- start:2019 stop:2588 length:570 start_codon:yes stop_codon:yes gene_type:complete
MVRNVKTDKYVKEISVLRAAQRDENARPHAKLRVLRRNGTKIANIAYAEWILTDQIQSAEDALNEIMEKTPAEQEAGCLSDDNGMLHWFLRDNQEWEMMRGKSISTKVDDVFEPWVGFWHKSEGLWTFLGIFQLVGEVSGNAKYVLRFNKYDIGKAWVGGSLFDVRSILANVEDVAEVGAFDNLDELIG